MCMEGEESGDTRTVVRKETQLNTLWQSAVPIQHQWRSIYVCDASSARTNHNAHNVSIPPYKTYFKLTCK